MVSQLTKQFNATGKCVGNNVRGVNFSDLWPIDLELSTDSRQVGLDRMGLDMVAHVNNIEAEHISSGLDSISKVSSMVFQVVDTLGIFFLVEAV